MAFNPHKGKITVVISDVGSGLVWSELARPGELYNRAQAGPVRP